MERNSTQYMKCNTYKEMPAHILGNTGVRVDVFLESTNIIDKISTHTSTVMKHQAL
jgi:hypothetical protein